MVREERPRAQPSCSCSRLLCVARTPVLYTQWCSLCTPSLLFVHSDALASAPLHTLPLSLACSDALESSPLHTLSPLCLHTHTS